MDNSINKALTHDLVFYRSYSRFKDDSSKESWEEVVDRTTEGLFDVASFRQEEKDAIKEAVRNRNCYPSGRWLWVGGTEWSKKPENFYSSYNCTSNSADNWEAFARSFDMGMQGTGTGMVLEDKFISKLPPIRREINLKINSKPGDFYTSPDFVGQEDTTISLEKSAAITITVGDSRLGWVEAYHMILELASSKVEGDDSAGINLHLELGHVRPKGRRLNGFGGVANPIKLGWMFEKVVDLLNSAVGRQLSSEDACLLMDIPAMCYVAGNIRRCLPKGSLVHTGEGLIPIEDVKEGMLVQTPAGFKRVLNNFYQGKQEVFNVQTTGPLFKCTANHKMAVVDDTLAAEYKWKKAGDLESYDDYLLHNKKALPGSLTVLPSYTMDHGRIRIPELTPAIAWFIGYTQMNSFVQIDDNVASITWGVFKSDEYADRIVEQIEACLSDFRVDVTSVIEGEEEIFINVNSRSLVEYLIFEVVSFAIPEFILRGNILTRAAYIAGLVDAEESNPGDLTYLCHTTNLDFASQVMAVASSLGLPTSWTDLVTKLDGEWVESYTVSLPSHKDIYNNLVSKHSIKGKIAEDTKEEEVAHPKEISGTQAERLFLTFIEEKVAEIREDRFNDTKSNATGDTPLHFKRLESVGFQETYDIEVEEAHCFYCNGYLTHNSAGMRQFDSDAPLLKQNLWSQDESGNWIIDEKRDPLRAANHTRVFHTMPSYDEVLEAVTSQYHSGEGAIQWAPEAIARANADLLSDEDDKELFLMFYKSHPDKASAYLRGLYDDKYGELMDEQELEHRLNRYGLNPCLDGSTVVMTSEGHYYIEDLVDEEVEIWDGKKWVTVDNFRVTQENVPVYNLRLKSGLVIKATSNHIFFKEDGTRAQLEELLPGDRLAYDAHQVHGGSDYDEDEKGSYLRGFLMGAGYLESGDITIRLNAFTKCCLKALKYSLKELELDYIAEIVELLNDEVLINSFESDDNDLYDWIPESGEFEILLTDVLNWSHPSKLDFIAGYFDSVGSIKDSKDGFGYQVLDQHPGILSLVQQLLLTIGVRSKVEGRNLTVYPIDSIELAKQTTFERLSCLYLKEYTSDCPSDFNEVESITFSHIADKVYCCTVPTNNTFILSSGIVSGNCGEIIGTNFLCNLTEVHLNTLDPMLPSSQVKAFEVGALMALALLNHKFPHERQAYSREKDPIIGVSFTGLFDFFTEAFGLPWLKWWKDGRKEDSTATLVTIPSFESFIVESLENLYDTLEYRFEVTLMFSKDFSLIMIEGDRDQVYRASEAYYLACWRMIVEQMVYEYCREMDIKMPNRFTTVQPAGCATVDAVRVSDNGVHFIDDFVNPNSGITDITEYDLTVRQGIKVNKIIANDLVGSLIRVTTKNNRQITLTPDHRLSVEGEWIPACELLPGMKLDYQIGTYIKEDEVDLSTVKSVSRTRPITGCYQPTEMSPELAYIIGALYGDGSNDRHSSSYRIRFSYENKWAEVAKQISCFADDLFGVTPVSCPDSRDREGNELAFSNKQMYEFLAANGLLKESSSTSIKKIPLAIRESSRQSILAFFCGLIDTDGCIRKEGSLSIDLANEEFIRHLQQVGEAVGLCFSVYHNTKGENFQGQKDMWGLCLSRMLSDQDSLEFINTFSVKAQARPLPLPKRKFKFNPYEVSQVEWVEPDYTYDYVVDGIDDDDSWYYQGAIVSHNSKSLLTGASSGWHPPFGRYWLRRITFDRNNPIALAAIDAGYQVEPGQNDKDENGVLLTDPYDPRVTEWLIGVPCKSAIADIDGAEDINPKNFAALAQLDFMSIVQNFYTTHNTSATVTYTEDEIDDVATWIYDNIDNNKGYVSAALLAKFDVAFPRLPYEAISEEEYVKQVKLIEERKIDSFDSSLSYYLNEWLTEAGPAACDSDKCLSS